MLILGIDPGLSGAFALICEKRKIIANYDMPTIIHRKGKRIRTRYDINEILRLYKNEVLEMVGLEKQQAMPGQGVSSMFSTGYGYGLLQGIFMTLAHPLELIHPKTWQKELFKGIGGDPKKLALEFVNRTFPKADIRGKMGGLKQGRVDALCIAEYCRRVLVK
jgi:crossover junction endodeoxyribonuclease RuvC